MIIPIILSGGSGTRLWPLSRKLRPKQFLPVHTEKTLFQETLLRLNKLNLADAIIVSNQDHRFLVAENAMEINYNLEKIILEPLARNTAPALAAASIVACQNNDDPILLVLPADHIIKDTEKFKQAVEEGEKLAQAGNLVTFGVVPTKPHTGFGYIECGENISSQSFKIANFKEKPNVETANEFLEKGNYFWNSGMFMFKASVYLKELKKYAPIVAKGAENSVNNSKNDLDFMRLDENAFKACPNISIDYAVMEKTDKAVVVKFEADWCDVGSWSSLLEIGDKDLQGNVYKGDVIIEDTKNSYFYAPNRLVTAIGLNDIIVVDTKDALLIADKNKSEDVKLIVEKLKKSNRQEVTNHRVVYRPWGNYDSICKGERDQVKRITVKIGGKLSLQKHHHRAEHWVVVQGTAMVTKGDEQIMLSENESVYLPVGTIHALENIGKIPLKIIEVQTGSYLGEDDIVRLEDIYGRIEEVKSLYNTN